MHEQSETIQRPDGKWINVYGRNTPNAGQQLPGTSEFQSVNEAVNAAGARSAMSGPWDKYGATAAPQEGPWSKYGAAETPTRAFESTPEGGVSGMRAIGSAVRTGSEFLSQRDPGIDYASGVGDAKLRAGFSFMSGDAEKSNFLNQQFGEGNWGKDSFGAYFVKPEGLKRVGVKSDKPVSFDEQTWSRYDVADIAGDVPTIAGGIAGGVLGSRAGPLAGISAAALGGAAGRAASEIGKTAAGYARQR